MGMSWLSKLKDGLSKTSSSISEGIGDVVLRRTLDDEALEELEELLIRADVGASAAMKIVSEFGKGRFDKEISEEEIKSGLAEHIAALLAPAAKPLVLSDAAPHVVLVVGVNGNGKTTTIGKMAQQYTNERKKVMLAAADTFRAAAVEQLQVWAERVACSFIKGELNTDPASVAYQALERAKAEGVDVLFIDTAGRLQNKANLMEELKKIRRVLQKIDETAPHTVLQVLDATTGQNALSQVEAFQEVAEVNGLVVTKLDGTAKAGVVVALAEKFNIAVHAIGVGEGIDDLQPFEAQAFADRLMGIK